MSLVVVRKCEEGINFVADTALIQPNDENRPSMLDPQLKVVFPFPDVAIAFAGAIHFAFQATEQVLQLEVFDLEAVKEILCSQNVASNNLTDFILATSEGNRIFLIKDGSVAEVDSAWVGDLSGFNKFQELFHGMDVDQPLTVRLLYSMKGVIEDRSIRNVDGLTVRADNRNEDKSFRYQISAEMYGGNDTFTIPAGVPVPIPFGSAASGAHRIDIFPCSSSAGCTFGFYYEIGEFGFVWTAPGRIDSRQKITNVKRAEFVHEALQNFNLEVAVGLCWLDYFKAGVKKIIDQDFQMAEHYCREGIAVQSARAYLPDQEIYFKMFFLQAEALAKQGRLLDAKNAMFKAIQLSPNEKELHWYLGLILFDLSDWEGAIDSLTKSIDIDPNYAQAYHSRGEFKRMLQIDDLGVSDLAKHEELTNAIVPC